MLHIFIQHVIDLLFHAEPAFIYLIVFLFLLLESCGVPVVNSTLLLLTGALVSLGHLNFWLLAADAVLGSVIGACVAYWIGERGGRRIFLKLAALFRVDEQKVVVAERWFRRSGAWMIFISRIMPYIRPFACFLAGISRLSPRRFLAVVVIGSLVWCLALIRIGMVLGRHWRWGVALMEQYTLPACLGLLLLMGLVLVVGRLLQRHVRQRFLKEPPVSEEARRDLLEIQ
jgi:membrane protein DedA with SNARE-associated domain